MIRACKICGKPFGYGPLTADFSFPCEHIFYGESRWEIRTKLDNLLKELLYHPETVPATPEEWLDVARIMISGSAEGYEGLVDGIERAVEQGFALDDQFDNVKTLFVATRKNMGL